MPVILLWILIWSTWSFPRLCILYCDWVCPVVKHCLKSSSVEALVLTLQCRSGTSWHTPLRLWSKTFISQTYVLSIFHIIVIECFMSWFPHAIDVLEIRNKFYGKILLFQYSIVRPVLLFPTFCACCTDWFLKLTCDDVQLFAERMSAMLWSVPFQSLHIENCHKYQ